MKKSVLSFLAGALTISAIAFTAAYEANKKTAEVDQDQGLGLFIRSTPVKEYESLGNVDMPSIVMTGKPKEMIGIAVKRAKKQYPNANGLLFKSDNFGEVEAILIK